MYHILDPNLWLTLCFSFYFSSNICHILPPVSTFEHNCILFSIFRNVHTNNDITSLQCRWLYEGYNLLLSSIYWDFLFSVSDVWSILNKKIFNVINRTIPTKKLFISHHIFLVSTNLFYPWLRNVTICLLELKALIPFPCFLVVYL